MTFTITRLSRLQLFICCLICCFTTLFFLAGNAPSAVVRAQDTLFEDTFDRTTNANWRLITTDSELTYQDGVMQLGITTDNTAGLVMTRNRLPSASTVSVEVVIPQGQTSEDWNAGVLLRADRLSVNSGWLQFQISGAGEWAILERTRGGDSFDTAKSGNLARFRGNALFILEVRAQGNDFTFSVNDVQVTTYTNDSTNADGEDYFIGLLAGTFTGLDKITAEFDNVLVIAGDPATPTVQVDAPSYKNVLLDDIFADNDNDWTLSRLQGSTAKLIEQSLEATVFTGNENGLVRWVYPSKKFAADVDVSVVVQPVLESCVGKWQVGLAVRFSYDSAKDASNLYLFGVNNDSEWQVVRIRDSQYTVALEPAPLTDMALDEPISLRVVTAGKQMFFFVNQEQVGTLEDASTAQDRYNVGIMVDAFDDKSTVTARFKEFVILGE